MSNTNTLTVTPTKTEIVLRNNQQMRQNLKQNFRPWKPKGENETRVGMFTIKSANETIKAAAK